MNISVEQQFRLTGHNGPVYALEHFHDSHFFSGGSDRVIAQWDAAIPAEGKAIAQTTDAIYSLKYLTTVNKLLAGTGTGSIHVIDIGSGKEEKILQHHSSQLFSIAYNEKSKIVFSLGGDGKLNAYDHSFNLMKTLSLNHGKLRSIAFAGDNSKCIVGCGDGTICVISFPEIEIVHQWQAHPAGFSVNAVCYSPDGKSMLSGSRDAHLHIYNAEDATLEQSIPAHNYAIYDISYHSSGKYFATAGRDKAVKIWHAATYEFLARMDKDHLDGHSNSVNKLLWINDCLLSTGDDRSIIGWAIS